MNSKHRYSSEIGITGHGLFAATIAVALVLLSVSCTPIQSANGKSPAPSGSSALTVSVTPATATLNSADSLQLIATVSQASNSGVTWSTSSGNISSQGFFVAPTVTSQTSVTITATSVQQSTAKASATISIVPANSSLPLSVVTTILPGASQSSSYAFHLSASGGTPPYQWALQSGQTPGGITLSLDGVLSGSPSQTGTFNFAAQVADSAAHQAQHSFVLVVTGSSSGGNGGNGGSGGGTSGGIPQTFFGMHIDYPNTPWPNVTVGGRRLWDSNTGWSEINTAPGVFDWTEMDTRVNEALSNNADVLYDFGRTPGWAQCASNNAKCGSGNASAACDYNTTAQGGPGQCFPPKDLNADGTGANQNWINWVTAVASRYKGQIKYYEIWNEPSAPAMWQGTDPQLVRMTQDARCIIVGTGCSSLSSYSQTGIDPSAQITTPAFVSDQYTTVYDAMQSYLQAGGGAYVDVIAYHGYVQWPNPPEQAASDFTKLQGILSSANQLNKPVFSTEGGYGVYHTITDQDQQTAWIARYLLLQQSSGIARSYWYAWDAADTPFWAQGSGTLIGGSTYGQIASWLIGATLSSPCAASGTVWQCGYTRPNGYKSLAVWDTSKTCQSGTCTTSSFNVPSGYTYSVDLSGNKTSVSGSTVEVGIKPILLENQ